VLNVVILETNMNVPNADSQVLKGEKYG